MERILPAVLAAGLLWPSAALAQSSSAPGDCARFDAIEAAGKADLGRQIALVDAAADAGDGDAFCQASLDLMLTYETMAKAAASCSSERAARWVEAEAASRSALSGTCQ